MYSTVLMLSNINNSNTIRRQKRKTNVYNTRYSQAVIHPSHGRIQGGGAHPARAPLKLEKIRFFGVNRDFSDEIPKQFSGLPPQLETIRFFGVK